MSLAAPTIPQTRCGNAPCFDGLAAQAEIGEFWSRETQIDVVGLRDDDWTDLGECK